MNSKFVPQFYCVDPELPRGFGDCFFQAHPVADQFVDIFDCLFDVSHCVPFSLVSFLMYVLYQILVICQDESAYKIEFFKNSRKSLLPKELRFADRGGEDVSTYCVRG